MLKNKAPKHFKTLILLTAIILFALAGMAIFSGNGIVSAAQEETILTLVPPEQAHPNELIEVKLVVNNAHNLAGYQSVIHYNANGLRIGGFGMEEGLARSGRGLLPLEPVEREGSIVVGAVTCPVTDCSTPQYDSAQRHPQGVDGYVELVTLELIAEAPGRYEFVLEDVQLVDPQGNQLGVTVLNNVVLEVTVK